MRGIARGRDIDLQTPGECPPGVTPFRASGAALCAFGVRIDGVHLSLEVCCLIEPVLDPDAVPGLGPTIVGHPVTRLGESLEKCAVLRGRCGPEV